MSPEPLFSPIAGRPGAYLPSAHTRGPWDAGAMHGGAPCALLANALQGLVPEMRIARLTFEFLGPVPIEAVTVEVEIRKPGKRFALLEGRMSVSGRDFIMVRAIALADGEVPLPADALWTADAWPPPSEGVDKPFPRVPGSPTEGLHLTGMEIRWLEGSVAELGPGRGWFRMAHPLLADTPTAPIARVCAAADFSNGASRVLDFSEYLFVNTDLTVTLIRPPAGEWVLMDSVTRIDPAGVGWASSALFDEQGPIGFAQQTLFVSERSAG